MMEPDPGVYHYTIRPHDRLQTFYWQLRFCAGGGMKSVLDVGCGTGFFSRYLAEQGQVVTPASIAEVTGIELNPEAAQMAQMVCKEVFTGSIEDPQLLAALGKYDVVLLGDILEHLRQPEKLLETIQRDLLNPGGWVVLSVPNCGHWVFRREVLRGRFPYRQRGLFDRTHLHFFTRQSLWELAAQCGYAVSDWAFSINASTEEDVTFLIFKPLYKLPVIRRGLRMVEYALAHIRPQLFAYQFVLKLIPVTKTGG